MFTPSKTHWAGMGLLLFFVAPVSAFDWLTLPADYSHGHQGERIAQHQTPAPAVAPSVSDFTRSGYRNSRSTLQFGQSADNYHTVEQWGPPVRPYDEWRFPFRPFSTPYPNWGPPFAGAGIGGGIGVGIGIGVGPFPGQGFGGQPGFGGHPGFWGGNGNNFYPGFGGAPGGYSGQPWFDGNYPNYPVQQPLNDRQFFARPPGF